MRSIQTSQDHQRGVVLVVSLIMLLAVTLIIVSASNISQSNLQIVKNLESREMARSAAIAAIEELMSSDRFVDNPTAVFVFDDTCPVDNERCYDVDNDGQNDITVVVSAPECITVTPVRNDDLDVWNSPDQASCYLPPAVYSMCANSVWEFEATATDELTGAEVSVRQGISVLTTVNNIDTACPT